MAQKMRQLTCNVRIVFEYLRKTHRIDRFYWLCGLPEINASPCLKAFLTLNMGRPRTCSCIKRLIGILNISLTFLTRAGDAHG